MKEKGSDPYNIVQGVNRVSTGIYSMHVRNDADDRNKDTGYESTNASNYDSNPTPGASFHQIYHHMKNKNGRLNPYWILLYNHIMVHMFVNCAPLADIKDADDPIDVYSSKGETHCDTKGTLENIGDVYLYNGLKISCLMRKFGTSTGSITMT